MPAARLLGTAHDALGVEVGAGVGIGVGVEIGVGTGVGFGVCTGVGVGFGVGLGVGVGVGFMIGGQRQEQIGVAVGTGAVALFEMHPKIIDEINNIDIIN